MIAWMLGLAVLYAVSQIGCLPAKWNLGDFSNTLLFAFAFLTIGVIGHLIVENVKQSQIQIASVLPFSGTLDWLHLRWAGIMQTVMYATIAVIGLCIAGMEMNVTDQGTFNDADLLKWIAAGYALDSIAGTVLTRFGVAAGKQVEAISDLLVAGEEKKT